MSLLPPLTFPSRGGTTTRTMNGTSTPPAQDYPSKPYFQADGTLVIPHDCDPRYHHWKGGQSVLQTLAELNAPPEVLRRYTREEKAG